jgi:F-type H+-transporting ATPase subunit delta
MSLSTAGERYGRALFELGEESGNLRELTEQLESFAALYASSADLRSMLDNPLVEEGVRGAVLAELATRLALSPLVLNAVRLLARRRRLAALPYIARVLERLSDEKNALLRATVTSARPLSDADLRRITAELERRLSRRVVVESRTDPSLIGGVVTRIGDRVIDGSLLGRLTALERVLQEA